MMMTIMMKKITTMTMKKMWITGMMMMTMMTTITIKVTAADRAVAVMEAEAVLPVVMVHPMEEVLQVVALQVWIPIANAV